MDNTYYKSKYLETKQFTLNEYNNTDKSFPLYCPDHQPYLCGMETPSYGLCKEEPGQCNEYTGEQTYAIYDTTNEENRERLEYGEQFGYSLYKHDDKNCSQMLLDSSHSYVSGTPLPNTFKIMTQNLWWSVKYKDDEEETKFHKDAFIIRMKEIAKVIREENPDVICFQEVAQLSFDILHELLHDIYPFYYEHEPHFDSDNFGSRKRTLETMCFSKYPVKKYELYGIGGNLAYNNSVLILEFENVVVFNVYLQAGTFKSPGQKDLWFNYSRCRYHEYLTIGRYLRNNNIDKPIVALGDFNTNLNGDVDQWPELKAFRELGLQDLWKTRYDINENPGNTEDTDVNLMRWNVKFEEKKYRIDGIFTTQDAFTVSDLRIVSDQPINIDSEMQELFYKYRIPNKENKDELIKRSNGQLQLWPSDHFGVIATLTLQ